jgi:hypothetical protein
MIIIFNQEKMSITTSSFILKTVQEGVLTAENANSLTVTLNNNDNLILRRALRDSDDVFIIPPKVGGGAYANVQALLDQVNLKINPHYNATFVNNRVVITSDCQIVIRNCTFGPVLGFTFQGQTSQTKDSYRSQTFTVDFYPPSTISDCNVFMRLVSAEIDATNPPLSRSPLLLSLVDLSQPVGTFTQQGEGCTMNKYLGTILWNSTTNASSRILTHIPDGLQTLTFRLDQLHQEQLTKTVLGNSTIFITIEFEVSTSR